MNKVKLSTGEYERLALLFYAIQGGLEDNSLKFSNSFTQVRIQSLIDEIAYDKVGR